MKRTISLLMALILLCGWCISTSADGILPGLDNLGSILPAFDTAFSDFYFTMESIIKVKPTSRQENTDTVFETYHGIETSDFDRVYSCLLNLGFCVMDVQAADWKADVSLISGESEVSLSYDLTKKILNAEFSRDLFKLRENAESWSGEVSAFSDEIFGSEMPTLSDALNKMPDEVTVEKDGTMCQTYLNFTETDYALWNDFLSAAGCSVDSYTMENGVLAINLVKDGKTFVFIYDRINNEAIMEYPQGTRAQKLYTELIPTPTPAPTPKPTATPKPTPTPKPTATPKVDKDAEKFISALEIGMPTKFENCTLAEENKSFIRENINLFKKGAPAPASSKVNSNFSLAQFKKKASNYANKLIKLENLQVFQVFSRDYYGVNIDIIGCESSKNPGEFYWLFACFDTGIVEDMYIASAYLLPSCYSSYLNTSNKYVWATFGVLAGAAFNKIDGRSLYVYKQANVRSGPGTDYYVMGFAYGNYVCVDEVYSGGITWYKIKYNNGYGYVASSTAYYR